MMQAAARTFELTDHGVLDLGSVRDLAAASASLPQGAYTTLRTYDGRRVLRLDRHFERLEESAALQGQARIPIPRAPARHALGSSLRACGHAESRLRLTYAPPRLFVSIEPFVPLGAATYAKGVACVTMVLHRKTPRAKDTAFIAVAAEAYRSLPEGINEGLMVAEDGSVLEGLSSNFFGVANGTLRTEGERVLLGVTRSLVLEVAATVLPVVEAPVPLEELPHLEECFITSVSREVLPVVRIDGKEIGGGAPGASTRGIMQGFASMVEREAEAL